MKKNISATILLVLALPVLYPCGIRSAAQPDWNLDIQEVLRWRGQYYDLAVYQDMLFLACKRGVEIYSLADPAEPEMIGSFLTEGLANGVAVNYPYLYVGDVYGFNIWDITDPASPVRLGGFVRSSAEGYQERLLYREGYVFVAAYSSGLQLIDVNDPQNPFIVAQADTPAYTWDLALAGDAAFLMDFFSMEIADISRHQAPYIRTSYEAMFAGGIVIDGSLAYLAYIDGLKVLDISDPFAPLTVSEIGPTGSGVAESITRRGEYAILAHQSYVEIYDVSIPSDPIQIAYFNPPGHPRKVLTAGNYLYTILDDNGFHVTDITDPAYPVPGRHVDPSVWGSRQDLEVYGQYLYLCDWNRGLVIYDTSDPDVLVEIGAYSVPGNLNEITLEGDLAYLSCYSELQVVDVSDPSNPQFRGYYKTTGNIWSLCVDGDRGYLCDLYSFQVLDISDPAAIRRIGVLYMAQDGTPYRCVVNGNTAYVAHSWGGLKVVDISHPEDPTVVFSYPGDTSKSYTTVQFGYSGGSGDPDLLYAMNPNEVDIFSLASHQTPQPIQSVSIPDIQFADFKVVNGYIYLAASNRGIFVMDIRDPLNPFPVARAQTPGDALGITADPARIYVADDYDLSVFKRQSFSADIRQPSVTVIYPAPGDVIAGKSAVLRGRSSDQDSGVRLIEISVDQGTSWRKAMGQQSWSFILTGLNPGEITVDARVTDWSGITTTVNEAVSFTYLPQRPRILLAGFENSRVSGGGAGQFSVSAIVSDPFAYRYIDRLELYEDGESTGINLEFVDESQGYAYYRAEPTGQFDPGDRVLYSLVAWDKLGNPSAKWPYLSVRD